MVNTATLHNMTDRELISTYSDDDNPIVSELSKRLELVLDGILMDMDDTAQLPLDFTGGGRDT